MSQSQVILYHNQQTQRKSDNNSCQSENQQQSSFQFKQQLITSIAQLSHYRLAIGSSSQGILVFNLKNKQIQTKLQGHKGLIWVLQKLQNQQLVSGGADGTLRIWNYSKNCCIKILNLHKNSILCLVNSFKINQNLIYTIGSDQILNIIHWARGQTIQKISKIHHDDTYSLLVLSIFECLTSSYDGKIKKWKLQESRCSNQICLNYPCYSLVKIDEFKFACGINNGDIRIYNIETLELIQSFKAHSPERSINKLMIINKDQLLSCSTDLTIKVWIWQKQHCIKQINLELTVLSMECLKINQDIVIGQQNYIQILKQQQ